MTRYTSLVCGGSTSKTAPATVMATGTRTIRAALKNLPETARNPRMTAQNLTMTVVDGVVMLVSSAGRNSGAGAGPAAVGLPARLFAPLYDTRGDLGIVTL